MGIVRPMPLVGLGLYLGRLNFRREDYGTQGDERREARAGLGYKATRNGTLPGHRRSACCSCSNAHYRTHVQIPGLGSRCSSPSSVLGYATHLGMSLDNACFHSITRRSGIRRTE